MDHSQSWHVTLIGYTQAYFHNPAVVLLIWLVSVQKKKNLKHFFFFKCGTSIAPNTLYYFLRKRTLTFMYLLFPLWKLIYAENLWYWTNILISLYTAPAAETGLKKKVWRKKCELLGVQTSHFLLCLWDNHVRAEKKVTTSSNDSDWSETIAEF